MWTLCTALALAVAAPEKPAGGLAPGVKLTADGKPISVDIGHAAPWVGDLKGEGKPQLLVGQFGEGKLRIYPNAGTTRAPKFTQFEWFKAGNDVGKVPSG